MSGFHPKLQLAREAPDIVDRVTKVQDSKFPEKAQTSAFILRASDRQPSIHGPTTRCLCFPSPSSDSECSLGVEAARRSFAEHSFEAPAAAAAMQRELWISGSRSCFVRKVLEPTLEQLEMLNVTALVDIPWSQQHRTTVGFELGLTSC